MHEHDVFGLRLHSELALPELLPAPDDARPADLVVRIGTIPPFDGERPGLAVAGDAALLAIPEVGRFLISGGREIVVEPDPAGSPRNVRLYLLGSAIGAVLHQRGLLPLHANAIEVDGRAIAFMGHSGAGKSTLAAWFHDRGYRILSDDVCVVRAAGDGFEAMPGVPRLRLWREALEASGRSADGLERAFDDMDKYTVPTKAAAATAPVRLSHVYLLERGETAAIAPLKGAAGIEALVANTYRGGYLALMDGTGRHLRQCVALMARAPVFSAMRRWGFADFEAEAAALEAHARAQLQ
jgi:hypothetical protein